MSNSGKSKISKVLEKGGFNRFEVDADIGTHLRLASITSVADWMGYPDGAHYTERVAQYLSLEEDATKKGMTTLHTPAALDTTGSVIYLSDATLKSLKNDWFIVNFRMQKKDVEEMFKIFIDAPKPVVWGDMFNQLPGESTQDSLKRCYPELLAVRVKKYESLADVNINRFALYKAKTADAVLDVIEQSLR